MSELKASNRNSTLGYIADLLTRGRDTANEYEVKNWVPLLGGTGIGDLLIGKAPEEINEWAYGNAPMRVVGGGTGSLVPQTKQGRQQSLGDAVFLSQMVPTGGLARVVKSVPEAVRHGAEQFAHASAAANPAIIKAKGGNWLTGSVENALANLKKSDRMQQGGNDITLEQAMNWPGLASEASRRIALNKWIEGPLTKYVKRDMATEGDPVRKLAEQGILHTTPDQLYYGAREVHPSGEALQKLAKSPVAKAWENASDYAITSSPAETYQNFGSSNLGLDWVNRLDPKTPFYRPYGQVPQDLGFSHLTDELANALNPGSGLPRNLLLTPEQMQQLGMEKAVRHVADINAWRAAQQAEANLVKSQSPAVHLFKEYAENNPKGLRWVELKAPDKLPEGYSVVQDAGGFSVKSPEGKILGDGGADSAEEAIREHYAQKSLQDQLKYEGDIMGHCVGGYCDDVLSGDTRIFSLRDAKGEPHVTIETRPGELSTKFSDLWDKAMAHVSEDSEGWKNFGDMDPYEVLSDRYGRYVDDPVSVFKSILSYFPETTPSVSSMYDLIPDRIVQVKGKQNLKPKDEYLPFVQDFVRSGKWGDVGDLQNTGLIKAADGSYMTREEAEALLSERGPDWNLEEMGYAQGGLVTNQNDDTLPFTNFNGIISNIQR